MKNALVAVNPRPAGCSPTTAARTAPATRQLTTTTTPGWLARRDRRSSRSLSATALTQNLQGKQPGYTINSTFNGYFAADDRRQSDQQRPERDRRTAVSHHYARDEVLAQHRRSTGWPARSGRSNVAAPPTPRVFPPRINGPPTLQNATARPASDIGIGDYPVRPSTWRSVYATFANGGVQRGRYLVQKVTDAKGTVLYQHKIGGKRAMDPKVANDVTLSLEPVASSSEIGLADGRTSAVKTGTVGIQNTGSRATPGWSASPRR